MILAPDEVDSLGLSETDRSQFIRRFVGSKELISGNWRYCIWINDDEVISALKIPKIKERVDRVKQFRAKSKKAATVRASKWPHRFDERKEISEFPVICVPVISSENRAYLPTAFLPGGTVVSNKAFSVSGPELWPFSVICSKLNRIWVATVCARMRTDYSYTNTLGWNTFPIPRLTEQNKTDMTRCAEDVLLAREAHFPATIADLYAPENMPDDLRRAHDRNDEVLERIFIGRRFKNDTERLETLFELYTKMTASSDPPQSTHRKASQS